MKNILINSFCKTIFLLCLLPAVLFACSSKEDKASNTNAVDYSQMTDEELIRQQQSQAQASQKELREKSRVVGAEVQSEDEIEAIYAEQAKKTAEQQKKIQEQILQQENAEKIAKQKAEQLEDEQRRLRNEKILAKALEQEKSLANEIEDEGSAGESVLDEAQVAKFVKEFEYAAYRDRDSKKLARLFSDDAVIKVSSSSMPNAMVMNKNQFIQGTVSSWSIVKNYSYDILSKEISIEDEAATVVGQQTEKMDMMGQTIEMLSSDTMEIELKNGRLLITKLDVETGDF